jgi:hypothetical protein
MDWFDDVVLVATEGPKFTKAQVQHHQTSPYLKVAFHWRHVIFLAFYEIDLFSFTVSLSNI